MTAMTQPAPRVSVRVAGVAHSASKSIEMLFCPNAVIAVVFILWQSLVLSTITNIALCFRAFSRQSRQTRSKTSMVFWYRFVFEFVALLLSRRCNEAIRPLIWITTTTMTRTTTTTTIPERGQSDSDDEMKATDVLIVVWKSPTFDTFEITLKVCTWYRCAIWWLIHLHIDFVQKETGRTRASSLWRSSGGLPTVRMSLLNISRDSFLVKATACEPTLVICYQQCMWLLFGGILRANSKRFRSFEFLVFVKAIRLPKCDFVHLCKCDDGWWSLPGCPHMKINSSVLPHPTNWCRFNHTLIFIHAISHFWTYLFERMQSSWGHGCKAKIYLGNLLEKWLNQMKIINVLKKRVIIMLKLKQE